MNKKIKKTTKPVKSTTAKLSLITMEQYAAKINAAREKDDSYFVKGCSDFLVKAGFLTFKQVMVLETIANEDDSSFDCTDWKVGLEEDDRYGANYL